MVKKKIEVKKSSTKIIIGYALILVWIFAWTKLRLFEWLADLFGMELAPVGSLNFWILFVIPMIPITIAAIYIANLHTVNRSINDSSTKSMFIASTTIFVSGLLLLILPFTFT